MKKQASSSASGQLLVLAAAVLWGTTGTAQAFAPEGATPLSVGTVRLVLGGAVLLLLVAVRGGLKGVRSFPLRPTILAAVGIAAYQICFFGGVSRTGVALGTIVGIGSAPVMGGLLEWLVYRQKPNKRWIAATALALAGSTCILLAGNEMEVDPLGVLMAMGAGLSYAVYTMTSKAILPGRSPDAVMAVVFALGALLLFPALFFTSQQWILESPGPIIALHLGLVTVTLAYILFGRGLVTVPVSTTMTLTLAEPLTAATLGIVVLGERLTALTALGAGLLLAGLVVLTMGDGKGGAVQESGDHSPFSM